MSRAHFFCILYTHERFKPWHIAPRAVKNLKRVASTVRSGIKKKPSPLLVLESKYAKTMSVSANNPSEVRQTRPMSFLSSPESEPVPGMRTQSTTKVTRAKTSAQLFKKTRSLTSSPREVSSLLLDKGQRSLSVVGTRPSPARGLFQRKIQVARFLNNRFLI